MRTMVADRGMGEPISLGAALASGKKTPPDVLNLLMDDHRTVLGWFAWYEQADDRTVRQKVTDKIFKALRAHMVAEEEIFYPAAARATGDDELVKRAIQEHKAARGLMKQIESSAVDESHAELMRELRAEIEAHIDEEENDLFPLVRESTMDRYEVGGAVAALRVDQLFEQLTKRRSGNGRRSSKQIKEYPAMQISQDVAQKYFVVGLKNAHASVKNGRTMVDKQLGRLKHYPRLKERLESHLKEKDAQLERIESLLKSQGESSSAVKDAAMTLMANISATANAATGDEVLKNSFAMLGLAKAEAAAYESLILFGQAAGLDSSSLRPLQQCLSEERGMVSFIEENLRGTGMGFLQLESQGQTAAR